MKRIKYSDEYLQRRTKWYDECWAFIRKADYKNATYHAKQWDKLFPDDTIAAFNYYSILADYALSKDTKAFKEMHKTATAGMKKLLNKTSGRGISYRYKKVMKNEYYFQSKQYKKQYYLGASVYKRSGNKYAMYSAGVGAAYYALEYAKKNNAKMAFLWAKKSIASWEIYFEVDKKYYNPYVHYAMAFGILGEEKKMMNALKIASKLSKQPMSYQEFSWTIKTVKELPYLK